MALLERSWESFEGRLGEESVGPAAITMATCMLGVLGSFSPSVPFAKLRDAISDSLASWQEDRQVELFEAAVEDLMKNRDESSVANFTTQLTAATAIEIPTDLYKPMVAALEVTWVEIGTVSGELLQGLVKLWGAVSLLPWLQTVPSFAPVVLMCSWLQKYGACLVNLRTAWNEFEALDRETADQQTSNKCHAAACEAYSLGQRTSYVLHVDIHIYVYIFRGPAGQPRHRAVRAFSNGVLCSFGIRFVGRRSRSHQKYDQMIPDDLRDDPR